MKFIVNEMPENEHACYFSEWEPYPPFIEKSGRYMCTFLKDKVECNLKNHKNECYFLLKEWDG